VVTAGRALMGDRRRRLARRLARNPGPAFRGRV